MQVDPISTIMPYRHKELDHEVPFPVDSQTQYLREK
jgi:hypothetical protein